jgi:DNA-binding transcriptional ArsR family regulator
MTQTIQFPISQDRPIRSSEIRELRAAPRPGRKKPNYASGDRASSVRWHRLILALARVADGPLTVKEIVDATGMSRQLAHYHVKKLAYRRELVWVFDRGRRVGETSVKLYWPNSALRKALGWESEARQDGGAIADDRRAA